MLVGLITLGLIFFIVGVVPAYIYTEHKEFVEKYLGGESFGFIYITLLAAIITTLLII